MDRMRKFILVLVAIGMASGCGGQHEKGAPNDPNEQQGNAKAKPEDSITKKSDKQPSDNQAGRNAHSGTPHANDNK